MDKHTVKTILKGVAICEAALGFIALLLDLNDTAALGFTAAIGALIVYKAI